MTAWDRSKALAAFETFKLTGPNAAVAMYWLSLWEGTSPPQRSQFNPSRVRDMLPAIGLAQVQTNKDVVCRLSGQFIDMAFGRPMRGMNLLDLVEGDERAVRSDRLCALVDGCVALSHTNYVAADGRTAIAESIQLPFYGAGEDGSRLYLTHTNWRPTAVDFARRQRELFDGRPDAYFALSIAADPA